MIAGITGVKGMLGGELARQLDEGGHTYYGYDLPELDISSDFDASAIDASCDVLINCAAWTDVDGAESKPQSAFAVNGDGAGRIARWCAAAGVKLVHISTDYVFDGALGRACTEADKTNPPGVYGASKLAGEAAVLEALSEAMIVRTQALFGPGGKNFPAAIISRLQGGAPLKVVNDQTVCPTCTGHLAGAILDLINADAKGIVHVSSSGECTWYEFACEIARRLKPDAVIEPVGTAAFPRPAARPAYSVLDKTRFSSITGKSMPHWKDALSWYLEAEGIG